MTKHYLFTDNESGEDFIVGAECLEQAEMIAYDYFGEDVKYLTRLSEAEAEMSGLDEY